MNTHHIPILLEVYRCGSINKAAQNLYMAQPQISYIIRSVEEEVGFLLFYRTRSGVTATPQGELCLESMRIVFGEMKKMETIPSQFQEKQDISLAVVYSRFLFQAFLDFKKENVVPGVTDFFLESMTHNVIEMVVSRTARLGILFRFKNLPGNINRTLERYGLESISLYHGVPNLAFLGKNHPLAREKKLTLKQIQQSQLVYVKEPDSTYLSRMLQSNSNMVTLVVSDRASLLEAVSSGQYLSLSCTASEKRSDDSRYVYLPVEGMDYIAEVICIKPRLYEMTEREKQLIHFIRDIFLLHYGPQEQKEIF